MPETLQAEFETLDRARHHKLHRARTHASMVMPSLLPWEGRAEDQPLPVPYNMLSAEGVNALAARIVSVLLPLNNQPTFETLLNADFVPEGAETAEMEEVLRRLERRTTEQLLPTNLRSTLFTAYKHLMVVADVLLYQRQDYNFQLYRLDHYVVQRHSSGQWWNLILREWVDPETDEIKEIVGDDAAVPDFPAAPEKPHQGIPPRSGLEPLYTRLTWDRTKQHYQVTREFREIQFDTDKTYKVSPYMPLRWAEVAGENYGISLIEDNFGDVRALDAMSKAVIDGTALNAEHRWGVNPAGLTEIDDLVNSVNGDWVPASERDIYPLQFQNHSQVQAALMAQQHKEERLGGRFLLNRSAIRQGERVTATEVSMIAQELENTLGGVLSNASREVQVPIIRRTLVQMGRDNMIPGGLSEIMGQEDGILKIRVKAGLEILNREAETEKINGVMDRVASLPEPAQETFKWPSVLRQWLTGLGFEPKNLVYSAEEMAQKHQQQREEQQAMMAAQTAQQAAVKQAGQPQQEPAPQ